MAHIIYFICQSAGPSPLTREVARGRSLPVVARATPEFRGVGLGGRAYSFRYITTDIDNAQKEL